MASPQRTKPQQHRTSLKCATVLAALLLLFPLAHAGAVFEVKEALLPNADDYKIKFDQVAVLPPGTPGKVVRSSTAFNATSIPMNFVTLNKCSAFAPHIHPNGAEQILVVKGAIEVGIFTEGNVFVKVVAHKDEAVYIPQGSVHYTRNRDPKRASTFLQLFDHPAAGTVFVGRALAAMDRNVVNSAFTSDFPQDFTGTIFTLKNCTTTPC